MIVEVHLVLFPCISMIQFGCAEFDWLIPQLATRLGKTDGVAFSYAAVRCTLESGQMVQSPFVSLITFNLSYSLCCSIILHCNIWASRNRGWTGALVDSLNYLVLLGATWYLPSILSPVSLFPVASFEARPLLQGSWPGTKSLLLPPAFPLGFS